MYSLPNGTNISDLEWAWRWLLLLYWQNASRGPSASAELSVNVRSNYELDSIISSRVTSDFRRHPRSRMRPDGCQHRILNQPWTGHGVDRCAWLLCGQPSQRCRRDMPTLTVWSCPGQTTRQTDRPPRRKPPPTAAQQNNIWHPADDIQPANGTPGSYVRFLKEDALVFSDGGTLWKCYGQWQLWVFRPHCMHIVHTEWARKVCCCAVCHVYQ